jgi:hypothetical protein
MDFAPLPFDRYTGLSCGGYVPIRDVEFAMKSDDPRLQVEFYGVSIQEAHGKVRVQARLFYCVFEGIGRVLE